MEKKDYKIFNLIQESLWKDTQDIDFSIFIITPFFESRTKSCMRKILFRFIFIQYIIPFQRIIFYTYIFIFFWLKIYSQSLRKSIFMHSRCFFAKITQCYFFLSFYLCVSSLAWWCHISIWILICLVLKISLFPTRLYAACRTFTPCCRVRTRRYIRYTQTFYAPSVLCPTLYTCATHSLTISNPHLASSLIPHQAP